MATIFIVDDDQAIGEMLSLVLENEGFQTVTCLDGLRAVEMFPIVKPDLILLDVMLPGLDGTEVARRIRATSNVPIIMLTARGEEYDKINGFECGADDYVVKPFSPKELMLRIEAVLKRTCCANSSATGGNTPHDVFEIGPLRCDITGRIVYVDGKRIDMSPKEYDLLFYMIRNRNIALSREKLITEVWGYDYYGDDRTLDTHIKLLRRSLGDAAKYIVTLRGVGYRFDTNE